MGGTNWKGPNLDAYAAELLAEEHGKGHKPGTRPLCPKCQETRPTTGQEGKPQ